MIDKKNVFRYIRAIWLNILGIGSLHLLCSYAGLVVYAYYDIHGCDPIKMKVGRVRCQYPIILHFIFYVEKII